MNRRAWILGGVGTGAALAGAGLAWWRSRAALPRMTAEHLWTMSFDAPNGQPLHLGSFRGRPLVVNFWASWCGPCVREMPQIDRFYRQFRSLEWQVVGLAVDTQEPVKDFLAKVPVSFPIGLAGFSGAELSKSVGNLAGCLTFTVAFNHAGELVQRKLGEVSYEELVSWAQPRA